MKNLNSWSDAEIKKLFKTVENYKKNNLPIINAFEEYANFSGRKKLSVRNYYYFELNNLLNNKTKCEQLGIDISLHKIKNFSQFSKEEYDNLVQNIEKLKEKNISVRKACLMLANNDPELMIRFQNKYREYLKKKESKEMNNKQVIPFPKKSVKTNASKLSDEQINSLFLGLVKLVKENAVNNLQIDKKENSMPYAIEIENNKKKIETLKNENSALKSKVALLEQKLLSMRLNSISKSEEK